MKYTIKKILNLDKVLNFQRNQLNNINYQKLNLQLITKKASVKIIKIKYDINNTAYVADHTMEAL